MNTSNFTEEDFEKNLTSINHAMNGLYLNAHNLLKKYLMKLPTHEIVPDEKYPAFFFCVTNHGGYTKLKRVFLEPDPIIGMLMPAYETIDGKILHSIDVNTAATMIEVTNYIQYLYDEIKGHNPMPVEASEEPKPEKKIKQTIIKMH